jgi:hypothetical protein
VRERLYVSDCACIMGDANLETDSALVLREQEPNAVVPLRATCCDFHSEGDHRIQAEWTHGLNLFSNHALVPLDRRSPDVVSAFTCTHHFHFRCTLRPLLFSLHCPVCQAPRHGLKKTIWKELILVLILMRMGVLPIRFTLLLSLLYLCVARVSRNPLLLPMVVLLSLCFDDWKTGFVFLSTHLASYKIGLYLTLATDALGLTTRF